VPYCAMCALLRNGQLGAQLPITEQDGAVSLKGSHMKGEGRIFVNISAPLSLKMTYRMSLISVGSISLDSIFKVSTSSGSR
jgi:hypothetical protein